jgi:hypothetical protein
MQVNSRPIDFMSMLNRDWTHSKNFENNVSSR